MAVPIKNKTKMQPPAAVQNFPIVGIGASAGGLDAFKRLLKAIPESSGMAYVLVQHLDPSHESILPEILQRFTKIPVFEITEDIHIAPDHIYIIPSNKILTSTDGVLKLTPREKKILNFSIDIFFTSLADVHKEFAVGVVLSGTGSDGTLGLKAIKEHGGISIAQDSESAAYDSMPQSAVKAGVVDFILPPEKIPAQLLQINSAYKANHFYKGEERLPKDDEYIFKQILLLLRQRSGVDFTYYKQPTLHRRIARRITIVKKKNLADYLEFLRTDKAEQDALFQDVLIPVTSFFRDPKTFEALTETVFPALFKNKTTDESIRVWIAGCSTGEEVYSIAICLHEFLGEKLSNTKIQIFATDISEKAIKKARSAIYSKAEVENLSETQLKNYFRKNNGDYEVNKFIRDMCVFAPHNFLKDPPFAKMDLITCRNVLIYMDTLLQKKAFATFHYALKENGFLLLGKSETTGASSDLFSQVSKHEKIYSRKPAPSRFMHVATERREEALVTKDKTVTKHEIVHTDFRKSAEAIMISKSPASVVVNEQMDIVHIHGDITPFLQAPQGKPTHNLIKMAREGLAFELRNAIYKAAKEQTTLTKENVPVKVNDKQSLVTIEIIPLTDTLEPHYLVRFENKIIPVVQKEKKYSSEKINETQKQNEQLEKELSQSREDMRYITEDMEAANEELQSANEELQSSNEEMQSLNEELETSKEELQSTNEELIIVNQELLDKQGQLNAARDYSDSIITTIREPLIVLDKTLRIKTANAAFYKKFNTVEHDTEGKLFYEIQNYRWDDSVMRSMLERIITQKEPLTDLEINLKFPSVGKRTLVLNARQIINEKNNEQLILLAIEDITEQAAARKIIEDNEKRSEKERKLLHDFFTQAPAVLAILKEPEHVFEFANPAYMEFVGNRNIVGKKLLEALPEIKGQGFIELLDNVYKTGEPYTGKEMPVMIDKGAGKQEQFYVNFSYQALRNEEGETEGILVFAYDVTEQVNARKKMEANGLLIRNIYMNAPASICTFKGPEHIYELVNPAYQKLFDKRDLVGKPFLEALPEVKGQGVDKILDNVYNTGEIFTSTEIPVTLARADNGEPEQRYFNTTMQPIYNEENKIIGIVNFGYDVTEQIMARKQIEASEKRFSNILSQSLMAIGIFRGPDMVVTYANEPMLNGLGKGNAVLNKPLIEGVPELKDQVFMKLLTDVYTTGEAFEGYETKAVLVRNGVPVDTYFNFVYQPYRDIDDTITGITVLATEVTDQVLAKKQIIDSEEQQKKLASQLKLATDSAQVGIWSLDVGSLKLEWSDMHKIMWGYDKYREDLTYEDWHKNIFPDDKEWVLKKAEEAKVNHSVYDVEYRINRANDGAIMWIKSTGQYYYDEFGVAHTFTGIILDISEQKMMNEELSEAKSKAESAKETAENALMSKQQFLSNMSHEIRTPLNAIIGFAKVLMKTDLTEKQEEYLQAVKSSGNTLIVLINDILDLAKVNEGKMVFVNAPFKISHSLTTILHLFETKIQENNLELVKEYDSRIPEILLGDSVRLHQILINLLSNAIKFTAKGKIIVSVNLLNEDEEKATIEIKVTDTGIGIPENKFASIFEKFEQAHAITSSLYGGTGLGLAIVKQLVEKQGGTVSVKSKVGKGSTFSFTLSFQKTQTEIEPENGEVILENEIKNIKVLIVEDVKLNQLLLRTILDDFKFACDIADNGKIAVEKLETNSYDIILMDLQMPAMNGFEATEYIRNKMNLQIPIIALTADVTTVDLEKCKAVGMNDYISKPIDEKILYNKILDLMKSK